jgi:hypothetical protein
MITKGAGRTSDTQDFSAVITFIKIDIKTLEAIPAEEGQRLSC